MSTTNKARQHDAHVRARRAILRRVVDRARSWSSTWASSPKREQIAAAKLAHFSRKPWPSFWTRRTVGRYPDHETVPARTISSFVIHSIMCTHLPCRPVGGRPMTRPAETLTRDAVLELLRSGSPEVYNDVPGGLVELSERGAELCEAVGLTVAADAYGCAYCVEQKIE